MPTGEKTAVSQRNSPAVRKEKKPAISVLIFTHEDRLSASRTQVDPLTKGYGIQTSADQVPTNSALGGHAVPLPRR